MLRKDEDQVGMKSVISFFLGSSGKNCKLRLWYWLTDIYYANLNVYSRTSLRGALTRLNNDLSSVNSWSKVELNIPESDDLIEVIFIYNKYIQI